MHLLGESFAAIHENGLNNIAYSFATNWWLLIFVAGIVICAVLGVKETSQTIFHEEQTIL